VLTKRAISSERVDLLSTSFLHPSPSEGSFDIPNDNGALTLLFETKESYSEAFKTEGDKFRDLEVKIFKCGSLPINRLVLTCYLRLISRVNVIIPVGFAIFFLGKTA